jgi:hypothetical protein
MFPSNLLTSDFFLSYAHARLEKCIELATLVHDKLAFVEISAYSTFLEWEATDTGMTYREYHQNIEGINDALRSIECCMPALHTFPDVHTAAPSQATDLSVALRVQCQSVRDLLPPLLRLRIPEIDAALSSTYDKLQRQLEQVIMLQHRVLILIPILRKQFMRSPQYIQSWNLSVHECSLREVVYLVSAFENRLLRFRVNNYVVHDDHDDYHSS